MRFFIANFPGVILVGVIAMLQTFLLEGHINVGDGVFYKEAFGMLEDAGLVDGYQIFQDQLGSSEFFSYGIFFVSSKILSYEVFCYLTNFLLATTVFFVYRKFNKSIIDYLVTVPFNFYFLVLCFGAQRLKLGILFLALAVLADLRFRKNALGLLSVLSHFQMLILVVAEKIRVVFSGNDKLRLRDVVIFLGVCVAFVALVPAIQLKIAIYFLNRPALNLLPFLVSFLIAAYFSKFELGVLLEFLFFLVAILILGESRVNVLVFFAMWRIIYLNRISPAWMSYVIVAYLTVKGFGFMSDIINGGDGFGTT